MGILSYPAAFLGLKLLAASLISHSVTGCKKNEFEKFPLRNSHGRTKLLGTFLVRFIPMLLK